MGSSYINHRTPWSVYEPLSRLHRFYQERLVGRVCLPSSKTISVGNLTWGGTGKTPLCAWLALRKGKSISAILNRGYKGGDEADLLRKKDFIVGKGKDRVQEASTLRGIQYWILDDGFQHWRLDRDVDIVCLDCLRPFGINGGRLIPFGSLRERPEFALGRASAVVLHNANLVRTYQLKDLEAFVRRYVGLSVPVVRSAAHQVAECVTSGQRVVLFSGLGNNEAFFKMMNGAFIKVIKSIGFPDHHHYSLMLDVRANIWMGEDADVEYWTTEKDLARCPWLAGEPLYAKAVEMEWTLEGGDIDAFLRLIDNL